MSALREAAQQALEALLTYEQYIQPLTNYFGGPRVPKEGSASAKVDAAITAIRAALAQEQAELIGKQDLQVESAATTQQRVGDAPPSDYRRGYWDGFAIGKREGRIEAEDAALAQQAEPKSLPCPTPKTCREHCCGGWCIPQAAPVQEQADPKPMSPEQREMWEELAAMPKQAEPLNLRDRAVQKRLAAQWGYVPAERAEPAQEPVAWLDEEINCAYTPEELDGGSPDGLVPLYTAPPKAQSKSLPCPAPRRCGEDCGGWCGPRAGLAQEQAEPLNLLDRAVQRRLAAQWGYVPAQAEPVQEPVAWLQPKTVDAHSRPDLGYETCSKDDYGAFPVHTAPPRRTMVPLTEREIGKLTAMFDARHSVRVGIARAVEKASWEKNHGQA